MFFICVHLYYCSSILLDSRKDLSPQPGAAALHKGLRFGCGSVALGLSVVKSAVIKVITTATLAEITFFTLLHIEIARKSMTYIWHGVCF